ncbi:unnamed protein product [Prorocentrum cordatum]|uniref:Methyltransferase type 11 domain-containing protein n=1 Tax=Prorocentrum cordatum TaxID=2364126 RepID=A0ABN9YDY0_9DINO|nr:unnamed protein product [Polarella glacialis]
MRAPLWSGAALAASGSCGLAWLLGPRPLADRLAALSEQDVRIDNVSPYDAAEKWAPDGSTGAGLHRLNPARVEYFRGVLGPAAAAPLRVLDIGCGGGLVSNALASTPGYEVHGLDRSEEALSYARGVAERHGTGAAFRAGSVYELPFAAESFDAIVISDVLEHLLDLPRALAEAARVLRPGGRFLFDTIDRSVASYVVGILGAEYLVGIVPRGTHDWRLFIRPEELRLVLERAGFGALTYEAFQPSLRALVELALFRFGLLPAESSSAARRGGAGRRFGGVRGERPSL